MGSSTRTPRFAPSCLAVAAAVAGVGAQDEPPAQKAQPVSIVLLETAPRTLDEEAMTAVAKRAFGARSFESEENFVVAQPPVAFVKIDGFVMLITFRDEPSVEDPEKAAEQFRELRVRRAFAGHRAMIHCVVKPPSDDVDRAECTRKLSRLVAEIVTDGTRAVSFSDDLTLFPTGPKTVAALRAPKPIAAMTAALQVPVVELDGEAVAAAMKKARRTWPQFLVLFDDEGVRLPAVKVARTEGEVTEHLWLTVLSADGTGGVGKVNNVPVDLEKTALGDRVTFRLADIEDWICYVGETRHGGYTVQLFEEAQRKAQKGQQPDGKKPSPEPAKGTGGGDKGSGSGKRR